MPSFPKPLKLFVVVAAATLALLTLGTTSASAKTTPCWKKLFLDYSADGRVDQTYPVRCYRQAIHHLGEDQVVYGSAVDDINRALQSAIRRLDGQIGPNTQIKPLRRAGGESNGGIKTHRKGVFGWLADKIGPGSASSIPLPLLVLAGLGLLLLAAAATSLAARRIQARRGQPATAPSAPPDRRK